MSLKILEWLAERKHRRIVRGIYEDGPGSPFLSEEPVGHSNWESLDQAVFDELIAAGHVQQTTDHTIRCITYKLSRKGRSAVRSK